MAGELPDRHVIRGRPERELFRAEIGDGGQKVPLMRLPAYIEGLKDWRGRHGIDGTAHEGSPRVQSHRSNAATRPGSILCGGSK